MKPTNRRPAKKRPVARKETQRWLDTIKSAVVRLDEHAPGKDEVDALSDAETIEHRRRDPEVIGHDDERVAARSGSSLKARERRRQREEHSTPGPVADPPGVRKAGIALLDRAAHAEGAAQDAYQAVHRELERLAVFCAEEGLGA